VLESLVKERRGLQLAGADDALLEASRLAIAYWQQELSRPRTRGSGNTGRPGAPAAHQRL